MTEAMQADEGIGAHICICEVKAGEKAVPVGIVAVVWAGRSSQGESGVLLLTCGRCGVSLILSHIAHLCAS